LKENLHKYRLRYVLQNPGKKSLNESDERDRAEQYISQLGNPVLAEDAINCSLGLWVARPNCLELVTKFVTILEFEAESRIGEYELVVLHSRDFGHFTLIRAVSR
jgi:hypothetical protein